MMMFDAFSKELKVQGECNGLRAAVLAEQFCNQISSINAASIQGDAEKSFPDAVQRRKQYPTICAVTHRETGEVRSFELNMRVYAAALSLAENLLTSGKWRVASLEEEQNHLLSKKKAVCDFVFKSENEMKAKELELAHRALELANSMNANVKKNAK